jgi:outer membrane protein assembly factor BamB
LIQSSRFKKLFLALGVLPALACFTAIGADLVPAWSKPSISMLGSTPAIDVDGTIYVTSSGYTNFKDFSGGKLTALSPQGKVKWEFKTFCDIKSSPAVDASRAIYFGCRDRKFHAVSPQGKEKWSLETGNWIDSSAAIAKDGTVYFGGWDKKFYALNPDGAKKWVFDTGGAIDSSPAIATDGTIYFGSHDKKFYALNPDGSQRWAVTTGGAILSSPALNRDGSIYFTSVDGNLYVLNRDGSQKLRVKTYDSGTSSPVLDPEGNIYLCITNMPKCLSPAGAQKWAFGYPRMDGAATIAADGTSFFGVLADYGVGSVFGFDTAGNVTLYASPGGLVTGSPAIAADGTIYLGSAMGFFAYKGNSPLAKSCWPKFRGDAAQTGRLNTDLAPAGTSTR